jgi:hypothetical protein
MVSNMSRRRRVDPPLALEPAEPLDPESDPPEFDVEYFVEASELDSVRTSVPNSLQSSQSWSSAPSTLTVVRDGCSLPHISHWGIHAIVEATV